MKKIPWQKKLKAEEWEQENRAAQCTPLMLLTQAAAEFVWGEGWMLWAPHAPSSFTIERVSRERCGIVKWRLCGYLPFPTWCRIWSSSSECSTLHVADSGSLTLLLSFFAARGGFWWSNSRFSTLHVDSGGLTLACRHLMWILVLLPLLFGTSRGF